MERLLSEEHISIFCKVLGMNESQIEKIYINPGRSANNSNFVIVAKGQSYLYRVPGLGTDIFCNREREALAYAVLSPMEITDEVFFIDKKTGIKISRYYENSRIPRSDSKDELASSMSILRKLHESKINFAFIDTLFDRAERYRKYALKVGGEKYYLDGFDEYLEKMNLFKSTLEKEHIPMCFTHGDASINNILITKDHTHPILIDIEFPAMGDPYGDIATFCIDAEYRKNDILIMLDYYLERKATWKEQYRLLGLCAVSGIMWYSWAAYKCAVSDNNKQFIDFRDDYHKYIGDIFKEINL